MRIAHVTDVYLPRLGGVELQVHDLAARQQRRGHATLVLTTTAAPSPGEIEGLTESFGDIPVQRLGGAIGAGPYRAVRDRDLLAQLAGLEVDAVHAHLSAFSPLAWSAARLAARTQLPTVVSVHSMWHDIVPIVRGYTRWHRAAQWPVTWAAVSTAAAGAVGDALDGAPVSVLANGIDPAAWLLPRAWAPRPVPTLVSVARMVRRKRPRALLRTLLALQAARPGSFRAVLVGDGPLLPALRKDIFAAGAQDDILLTGALDRGEIRNLLANADLYLAPAPRESFGIAALEARSAGLPVIARSGSGVGDFIRDGVEGWLVGSDDEMFSMVSMLLDSPRWLADVRAYNRAVAPSVHWDAVLDSADALYARAGQRHSALVDW
jgi:glycosyltransferase involved in cell wall biosynthesis